MRAIECAHTLVSQMASSRDTKITKWLHDSNAKFLIYCVEVRPEFCRISGISWATRCHHGHDLRPWTQIFEGAVYIEDWVTWCPQNQKPPETSKIIQNSRAGEPHMSTSSNKSQKKRWRRNGKGRKETWEGERYVWKTGVWKTCLYVCICLLRVSCVCMTACMSVCVRCVAAHKTCPTPWKAPATKTAAATTGPKRATRASPVP